MAPRHRRQGRDLRCQTRPCPVLGGGSAGDTGRHITRPAGTSECALVCARVCEWMCGRPQREPRTLKYLVRYYLWSRIPFGFKKASLEIDKKKDWVTNADPEEPAAWYADCGLHLSRCARPNARWIRQRSALGKAGSLSRLGGGRRCCCDAAVGASLLVVEWRPSCTPDWERYATVGLPEAIVHLRSGPPNGRPSSQTNLHLYRPGQADTLTHTPDLSHTWSRSPLPTSWTAPSPTRQPAHGAAPTGPRRSMPDSGALLTPVTPLAAPDGTPRAAQLPPRTGWAGHPPHEACGASPTLAWANLGSYLTFSPAGTDRGRRAASGVL